MTCRLHTGDALEVLSTLETGTVQTIVTSPPYYGLRDYGTAGQLGQEDTPAQYLDALVRVFREARRVLKDNGTLWLNLGDSYAGAGKGPSNNGAHRNMNPLASAPTHWLSIPEGLKPKDLLGIPWRAAFALQADGWYLRQDIIWHKPNPMPESVTDRCTKAHEYVFLLTKSERYYYDHDAIKEQPRPDPRGAGLHNGYAPAGQAPHRGGLNCGVKHRTTDKQRGHGRRHAGFNDRWDALTKAEQAALGRNKRSVWTVATRPYPEAHFATYPPQLIEPCILAGSRPGDTVLDPFNGSGTTGEVALRLDRCYVGIEINPEYVTLTQRRLAPVLAQPRLLGAAQ